ncbi:MAG: hypothetical protein AAF950_18250 [Pseudomonadota bacterium]
MQHLTVVYAVHDMDAFESELDRVKDLFDTTLEKNGRPWMITAMSSDHEMIRLDAIREALGMKISMSEKLEVVQTLLDSEDVTRDIAAFGFGGRPN